MAEVYDLAKFVATHPRDETPQRTAVEKKTNNVVLFTGIWYERWDMPTEPAHTTSRELTARELTERFASFLP